MIKHSEERAREFCCRCPDCNSRVAPASSPASELSPPLPASATIDDRKPALTPNPKDVVGSSKAPMSTVSAAVTAELGVAMLEGALKYGRHNYRLAPIRASVYFDAVHRHLRSWFDEGEDTDPASGMSHITKAIATLAVLRDSMITGQWDDDRPPPVPPGFFELLDAKAAALVAQYPEPKRVVRADEVAKVRAAKGAARG